MDWPCFQVCDATGHVLMHANPVHTDWLLCAKCINSVSWGWVRARGAVIGWRNRRILFMVKKNKVLSFFQPKSVRNPVCNLSAPVPLPPFLGSIESILRLKKCLNAGRAAAESMLFGVYDLYLSISLHQQCKSKQKRQHYLQKCVHWYRNNECVENRNSKVNKTA